LNLHSSSTDQEFIRFKVMDKGLLSDSDKGRADLRITELFKLFDPNNISKVHAIQLIHHEDFNKSTGKLYIQSEFKASNAQSPLQQLSPQPVQIAHQPISPTIAYGPVPIQQVYGAPLIQGQQLQQPVQQAQQAQHEAHKSPSSPAAYVTVQAPFNSAAPAFSPQYNVSPFSDSREGDEFEPMLLLDTTSSMNYSTSKDDKTPRRDTVREAISLLVEELAQKDSQGEHEEGGGGLRTVTFSGGTAYDIEDLHPENLREKWKEIRFQGGAFIIPGWKKLLEVYNEEFGGKAAHERPKLLALIITDGEAEDTDEFAQLLVQKNGVVPVANLHIVIAVLGYGAEHQRAINKYTQIANISPPYIRVVPFGGETDPIQISNALLATINKLSSLSIYLMNCFAESINYNQYLLTLVPGMQIPSWLQKN
jgi:hypothetical protein